MVREEIRWTGGCQCGALRYRLRTAPAHVSICHCRMCQKASGQPFMAFARVKADALEWTKGQPSIFRSSDIVERGFCPGCGTPLTYCFVAGGNISVTLGSLDDPRAAAPELQYGVESRLAWVSRVRDLPAKRTEQWLRDIGVGRIDNRQHPDRESP